MANKYYFVFLIAIFDDENAKQIEFANVGD
jgi:hypothetical protein